MSAEPFAWNVVVNGAWNTAILSPDGVRRRLFDLPEGTPIELEVAVDRPGPFRIGYEGLIVIPGNSRLEVTTRVASAESLRRACGIGQRALTHLPETPVSAAGVNLRFRFDELPDRILDAVRAPLDGMLADAGFLIDAGSLRRTLVMEPGVVNVSVTDSKGSGALELNFHRDSPLPRELGAWLGRADEFFSVASRLAGTLGVAEDVQQRVNA